ncbi:MAG: phosphotransferase [Actinobacteria bacterium]|nr:phosphotransferase [Actinomycetota bacterium]
MSDLLARVASEQARPLPPEGVAAVVGAIWPGGVLTAVERLVGGLGAATHRLDVVTADGTPDAVVLRSFLAAYGDGPAVAEREHTTLTALTAAGAAAPAPRWLDASGAVLGRPALAMTVAPGRPVVSDRSPDVVALGDPARDLAYCRYDLALGTGQAAADGFTAAYLAAGGVARPSPYWDLVAVASSLPTPAQWLRAFVEFGRDDCSAERFEAAGRAFLADALGRLG